MPPKISLACLNIEMSKHLGAVGKFLSQRLPEVVCLQELFEQDVQHISSALGGAPHVFVPMSRRDPNVIVGIGIFSWLPIKRKVDLHYRGSLDLLPRFDSTNALTKSKTQNQLLLVCEFEKEGALFHVGTTHFTWTPNGRADDIQRHDLKILLDQIDTLDELVLCGDFNFPRGGELFTIISNRLKDNIPTHYITSIDPKLHRAGALQLMVDGLFSSGGYVVTDVELHSGVSDHCAITAEISRAL
jgi:endonuclease/exonuclease/phosphatase family metal-dependent hydrolase